MATVALPQRARRRRVPRRPPRSGALRTRGRRPRARRQRRRGSRRASVMGSGGGGRLMSSKRVFGNSFNASRGSRCKIVENDEFIGAVNGSVAFANTAFQVNPGNSTTFPWLAVESTQWEKYQFEYLEFYFEHEVSEFATNGQAGKIILSFDYDASDPPPTTKTQVENTDPHIDAMPCEDIVLKMDPREMEEPTTLHFVRRGIVPGGADIKFYDVGILNVSTQGNTDATEIGELHVRYRCRFEVPILESTVTAPLNTRFAWFESPDLTQGVATGVAEVVDVSNATFNGIGATEAAGLVTLPAGNYLIIGHATANDTSAEALTIVYELQKNGVLIYQNGVRPEFGPAAVSAGGQWTPSGAAFMQSDGDDTISIKVTVTGAAGTLTVSGSLMILAV